MNSKELQKWLASQTNLQLRENPAASISVSQEAQWVSNQYSGAFLRQVAEFRGLI